MRGRLGAKFENAEIKGGQRLNCGPDMPIIETYYRYKREKASIRAKEKYNAYLKRKCSSAGRHYSGISKR